MKRVAMVIGLFSFIFSVSAALWAQDSDAQASFNKWGYSVTPPSKPVPPPPKPTPELKYYKHTFEDHYKAFPYSRDPGKVPIFLTMKNIGVYEYWANFYDASLYSSYSKPSSLGCSWRLSIPKSKIPEPDPYSTVKVPLDLVGLDAWFEYFLGEVPELYAVADLTLHPNDYTPDMSKFLVDVWASIDIEGNVGLGIIIGDGGGWFTGRGKLVSDRKYSSFGYNVKFKVQPLADR